MSRLRSLFLATRPMFFPASAVPVVVGTAWGLHDAVALDGWALALALVGMFCLHAAANVINDVGDELNGADRLNEDRIAPFTGGSRFIQNGTLSVRDMLGWGMALLAAALVLGLVLIYGKGQTVLYLGLLGAGLAVAYSLPPLQLASRGLGELAVAVAFGVPVAASAWLQQGQFSRESVLAAAAVGCWTAAILVVNEVPDRRADAAAGKRTLVVRLGATGAQWLYLGLNAAALAAQAMLLVGVGLPPWTLIVPGLGMVLAAAVTPRLRGGRQALLGAIRATLSIHLLGGIWLALCGLAALG